MSNTKAAGYNRAIVSDVSWRIQRTVTVMYSSHSKTPIRPMPSLVLGVPSYQITESIVLLVLYLSRAQLAVALAPRANVRSREYHIRYR